MSILLRKEYLGTENHLVLDDGQACWMPECISTNFVLGDISSYSSIEPILELYNISLPELIPQEHRKSLELCGAKKDIPWRHIIPRRVFKERLRKFVDEISEIEKKLVTEKYPLFFVETNRIFQCLEDSRVDINLATELNKAYESSALKNMIKLQKGSILPPPTYSRVASKTGRLTVKAGPQILTLRKDMREIFESTFAQGALFEIDFVSLEPRVALNLTEYESSIDDVYQEFITTSKAGVCRETAKLAVLCSLYGAGTRKLEDVLSSDNATISARNLMTRVSKFFGLNRLAGVLRKQAESGFITNYFGRPIDVAGARDSILINNFLQSTAADIALQGFCDFIDHFPECRAVFIIHDALIIDIPHDEVSRVEEYAKAGFIHSGLGKFPLKFTRLKK